VVEKGNDLRKAGLGDWPNDNAAVKLAKSGNVQRISSTSAMLIHAAFISIQQVPDAYIFVVGKMYDNVSAYE
jgi:fumarylacetoacetate (FAA) hydrolase family protein